MPRGSAFCVDSCVFFARSHFGYSFAMIQKNEKMGGRHIRESPPTFFHRSVPVMAIDL